MKKHIRFLSVIIIMIFLSEAGCSLHYPSAPGALDIIKEPEYKNIIIMVPDGCSMSIQTFARLYKGSDINLDKLHAGSVRTFSANSIITDSAAAATAFATGHKTTSGFIPSRRTIEDTRSAIASNTALAISGLLSCL